MRQVCIGRPKELLPEGLTDCVVTGWGRRSESESPSSFQWSTSLGDQRVSDDHQRHYHIDCYQYQKHNSTVVIASSVSRCHQQRPPPSSSQTARHNLWFSKRPQFSCVCYVAAMMALPSQSLSTSSSSSRSQKRLPMCPYAMIAIKNILTDSEHSVVLKEISVPLWDHDRCFFFFWKPFK